LITAGERDITDLAAVLHPDITSIINSVIPTAKRDFDRCESWHYYVASSVVDAAA
jgi:hypothetical protein